MSALTAARLARAEATGRRRAPVDALTFAHDHRFKPRHCAGTSCLHDHPGQVSARPSVARRSA